MSDDKAGAAQAILKKILSIVEPIGKVVRSTVWEEGRTVIPKDVREHMKVGKDDELNWIPLPGDMALVKKAPPAALLIAIIAVGFFAGIELNSPELVYAQTAPPENIQPGPFLPPGQGAPASTGPTQGPINIPPTGVSPLGQGFLQGSTTIPEKHLKGPTAYYPLRIDITVPTGEQNIQNITSTSPLTKYNVETHVGFPTEGLTTITFTTAMTDSYNMLLGQKYKSLNFAVPQVARISVVANGTSVLDETYPIKDNPFAFHIIADASAAPHIPTAEEIARAQFETFKQVIDLNRLILANTDSINRNIGDAANGFRISVFVNIILMLIGLVNITMAVVSTIKAGEGNGFSLNRFRKEKKPRKNEVRQEHDRRGGGGAGSSGDPGKPPSSSPPPSDDDNDSKPTLPRSRGPLSFKSGLNRVRTENNRNDDETTTEATSDNQEKTAEKWVDDGSNRPVSASGHPTGFVTARDVEEMS